MRVAGSRARHLTVVVEELRVTSEVRRCVVQVVSHHDDDPGVTGNGLEATFPRSISCPGVPEKLGTAHVGSAILAKRELRVSGKHHFLSLLDPEDAITPAKRVCQASRGREILIARGLITEATLELFLSRQQHAQAPRPAAPKAQPTTEPAAPARPPAIDYAASGRMLDHGAPPDAGVLAPDRDDRVG